MTTCAQPASPTKPVVLYVDDRHDSRLAFARAFGDDFEIATAEDATSALAVLELREIAVVVTNLNIQGLTGDDLLRIMRGVYPRTRRIAIGGEPDIEELARSLEDGLLAHYFIEPWQTTAIAKVLHSECAGWSPSRDPTRPKREWLHDLRSVLMTILANAEHLEVLGEGAAPLREPLQAGAPLDSKQRRELSLLVAELVPIARDLATTTRELRDMIEELPSRLE